jgi:hypothetical protein
MLLCDGADEQNGKLFILGGGWSIVRVPNVPTPMTLAVKMAVPWDQANQSHPVEAKLVTEDGDQVEVAGNPMKVEGQIEVGRPPGMKPGTPIDAPFTLNFGLVPLPPGGYVWELDVDGTTMARAPFRVLGD